MKVLIVTRIVNPTMALFLQKKLWRLFFLLNMLPIFFRPITDVWASENNTSDSAPASSFNYQRESEEEVIAGNPAVLVVAPPVFNSALQPWIEYRQSQGYDIFLLPLAAQTADGRVDFGIQTQPIATPEEIRAKILKAAEERNIAAIVLVGDGAPTINAKYGWRDVVPAARAPASVVQLFGSEDSLATDSFYADFDNDGLADVPIGRFPAETSAELSAFVSKIIRYETSSPVGNWMRRINIITGSNGLDLRVIGSSPGEDLGDSNPFLGITSLVDSVVDNMARKMFSEFLPQEFSVSLTQCSIQSVFCPYPPDFGDVFLQRANEGSLFLIYIGHGRAYGLDRFQTPTGDYGIFEVDDCDSLNAPSMFPLAFFFACYTGAYDANEASLAEKMVLNPNGPVACYAASRLTAPYGMCVIGASLMEQAFQSEFSSSGSESASLGQIILDAQKKSLEEPDIYEETSEPPDSQFDETLFFDAETPEATSSLDSEMLTPEEFGDEQILLEFDDDIVEKEKEILLPGSQLEKLNVRLERSLRDAEENKRKNSSFRRMLDRSAAIFDPTANRLDEQIKDHILEFNLFGDPLLRIQFPQRIKFDAPEIAYSTKEIVLSGMIPTPDNKESVVQAELLLADFRTTVKKPKRKRLFVESDENKEEFRKTYTNANNFVVDAVRTTTQNRRFQTTIIVPANYSGESIVRIAAFDGNNYYIGAKRVLVRPYSGMGVAEP